MIIGAHLSASKGYTHMLEEALSIGANTFQFFTRNPRVFSQKGGGKQFRQNSCARAVYAQLLFRK